MKAFAQFATSLTLLVSLMGSTMPDSLEDLPTGEYYYQPSSSERALGQFVWFRKAGRTVVGMIRSESGNFCFRGFAEGNQIVNATRVFPPYDPASRQDFQEEMLDLSRYSQVEPDGREGDRTLLQSCIQFFWR
ncbi:MAG: hypothetical protein HC840_25165 [Leptolyngbyaceae cyanobacterium RM2_2_4]|nr:hypothetical protein [Leptolyngbyaceae cyanobacterium SM1_4_3]NJN57000.1 hypothetical protein [Leptolyngbyaceae cyanobacterium SL_5_9]NJO52147.1 hypothetical protein [Leptolyngbyaceae cyanobacterium RM2_2_4]NJO67363.1 hypothetical protein [Leptolyngbyaceae cyanobacterium RM1_405_57]